jgi:hypothetical protein
MNVPIASATATVATLAARGWPWSPVVWFLRLGPTRENSEWRLGWARLAWLAPIDHERSWAERADPAEASRPRLCRGQNRSRAIALMAGPAPVLTTDHIRQRASSSCQGAAVPPVFGRGPRSISATADLRRPGWPGRTWREGSRSNVVPPLFGGGPMSEVRSAGATSQGLASDLGGLGVRRPGFGDWVGSACVSRISDAADCTPRAASTRQHPQRSGTTGMCSEIEGFQSQVGRAAG